MRKIAFAGLLLVLFAGVLLAKKQDVTITSEDGFALKASLYPGQSGRPGILMLHQCNADRAIYDNLATMLQTAGYSVLALDFRGFGGSKNAEFPDFASQRQKIQEKMPADVDAAYKYLASQKEVNKSAIGVVGGSCGVNQAVQAGRRHPEVKTLVLLSGTTDADGEAYIKNSKVPIFAAASEEDTNAAATIKKISSISTNSDSKLTMYNGAGHAASMFAKEKGLEPAIADWFKAKLK